MNYKNIAGMFNPAHKAMYDEVINLFPDGTFLEIGVLFGRSLIYLAQNSTPKSKIIGIDLFPYYLPPELGKNAIWFSKLKGDLNTAAIVDNEGTLKQYEKVLINNINLKLLFSYFYLLLFDFF